MLDVHAQTAPPSTRLSRVQGSAMLGRNRPVAGATVLVATESGTPAYYLTSTDAKGSFHVDGLPEGTYAVEFSRDGLAPIAKSGIVVKPPYRGIVEVTMSAAGGASPVPAKSPTADAAGTRVKLTGVVLDAAFKQPVSDVKLRLVRAGGPADPHETLTASDGSFSVDDLPAGRWTLESLGLAFLPLRAELRLTGDATAKLVLVGQPATYQAPALDLVPREEPIPPAD